MLLLMLAVSISAQTNQNVKKTYKILGVSIEGNALSDPNTILFNSGLRVGDEIEVPGEQTLNAIKNLWNLGIFGDVQISIERQMANGVYLLIKVKEIQKLEKIVIEGNDEISESDLTKKISLVAGQTVRPQDLYALQFKIKAAYDDESYMQAKIDPILYSFSSADTVDDKMNVIWKNVNDPSDVYKTTYELGKSYGNIYRRIKDRVLLKIKIDEGEVVKVDKIEFLGNKKFTDDDLKGEFKETSERRWWKFWSSAKFKKKKYEEDKVTLKNFYKKMGYRDFDIIKDSLVYSSDKKYLTLQLSVFEGDEYRVRNITWEGNSIYPKEALDERLDFKKGDVYDIERFNQNLRGNQKQNDVSALYLDNGYLGFNVKPIETRVGKDSVDVNIRVNEGNRFRIGKVDITGNDKTKDKVIRRELYTVPRDYFSRAAIMRSIQQLANLQYFNVEKLYQEGVDYQPSQNNDSTVNLAYKVEEKSSDYLNASVGYSGSWGMTGSVGITLTNFSIAEPFQMGSGQVLNFNWQFGVSNYYRTFTLGFTEPWFMDTPTSVGFEVFDTRQSYYYEVAQTGGTVRVGRRLRWPDDYFYLSGYLRYQKNNIEYGGSYYSTGKYDQFTLGLSLSRKDIDNPVFPSQGSSVSVDYDISGGPFLPGDVKYHKITVKNDWYKRLFGLSRLALYYGSEFGIMDKFSGSSELNMYEYYYMGGNGMVVATTPLRGYDDRTIGPKTYDGSEEQLIGGSVMVKHTLEVRAAAALEPMPIYFLVFAEAGNVYYNMKTADFTNLRRSVGFGARLLINPVGLVGFDFGYGFDKKAVDGGSPTFKFHFQFGKGM